MKKITIVFFVAFFFPVPTLASVRINEIAWMGDSASADHEWIELYNDGDASQDLSGWKLVATDTNDGAKEKFSLFLTGVIDGKGYFLIERKRGTNDIAPYLASNFTAVSFSLLNTGETLSLKNASGSQADEVKSLATKWQEGDNATKETMQWNAGSWITAKATPRSENASVGTPPKTSSDENKTSSSSPSSSGTSSSSFSSSDTSAHASSLSISDFFEQQEFLLSAGRDRIVPAGGILPFDSTIVDAKGKKLSGASGPFSGISFVWSFGDGTTATAQKISHTYEYPGNYIVILNAVSPQDAGQGSQAVARANVRVFAPDVALSFGKENEVSLSNHASREMNIGGWKLRAGNQTSVFPQDTVIGAKTEVVFSPATTKFSDLSNSAVGNVALLSPSDKIIAEASMKKILEEKKETVATTTSIVRETTLQNMKTALDRVAVDTENVRRQLATATATTVTAPLPPKRNIASYQYATAIDLMKKPTKETATSSDDVIDEKSHTLTIEKPEGFFSKIRRFFFP